MKTTLHKTQKGIARKMLFLLMLAIASVHSQAQTISDTTYPVSFTTGVGLLPVPGITTVHVGSSNDDIPGPLNAFGSGFVFSYAGVQYSSVSVSPDGFLRLGTAAASQFTNNLASTTNTPIIAPYWDDLATGSNGQVRGFLTGTAPNRIYVIDWLVTIPRMPTGAAGANFQCWLYENGGRIQFVYGSGIVANGSYSVGHAVTAGSPTRISSVTINGTTFTTSTNAYLATAPNNSNAGAIASGNSISWIPPAPSSATTTAIGGNWSSPSTWVGGVVPSFLDTIRVVGGSNLTLDLTGNNFINQLEINGTLDFTAAATGVIIQKDLIVNAGGVLNAFNLTTGKNLTVGGNILNDGTIDLSKAGSVLTLIGVSTQTVSGSGTLTSNTIASLTFNNAATVPLINWNWSNNIVATTLTITRGFINLGALNSLTLGTSGTSLGTLTVTNGGFTSGKFGRWFGTAGTGTTIAASTVPAFGVGSFPFVFNNPALGGYGICNFHRATAALTSAGIFEVRFTGATGVSALSSAAVESAIVLDSQTNAVWTVSTAGGYSSSIDHSFAIQGQNTYVAFGTNARLLVSGTLSGTHQVGTSQPMVQRTAVPAGSIAGDYTIGIVGSEFPTSTLASGAWNDPLIWSNGSPVCGKNVIINPTDSVWMNGSMGSQSLNNIQLNGKLTVNGGTLNAGCLNNNISIVGSANSRLTVTGGALNINGNLSLAASSFFSQTGGNINIDGNASGVPANSVPSGTPLSLIATGNVTLSGGLFTIVDPHAGAVSLANNLAFSYTGGTAINNTTGWTLKFGDGVSTDTASTTANAGFVMNMAGSKIVIDSLVIDAGLTGTNRFVTLNNATTFGCNTMNITANGQARISSQTVIARNLINNGRLVNTAGAVTFGTFLSAAEGTSPFAQVVSGTGGFRNLLLNSTASFTTLTINNNHPSGVSLLADSVLLGGSNTGTVSGTVTLTNGIVYTGTGTRTFVLGTSTASNGTLSYAAGGFGSGSIFSRWWPTTGNTGQTIAASTIPTAGVGTYPFVNLAVASPFMLNSRIAYVRQLTASTTGGRINIKYNDLAGLSTVSITDGSYTVNNISNANWQVSTSGITGTPTYTVALSGAGIYPGANSNSRIILASGPLSGTHQAGTVLPNAQRATVLFSDMNTTWYIGADSSDIAFRSVVSGNWENGATWNKGVVPSCSDSVVIDNGHTVVIGGAAANARSIAINTTGVLTITGNTTTVGCTMNNAAIRVSGKLTVSGGTVNINGALINNPFGRVHQLGGTIIVDGNDSGKTATSWAGHQVDMFANTDTSLIFTGGTFRVVDPTVNAASAAFKLFPSQPVNFGLGHTLQFGNGVSTEPGGALGYQVNLFNAGTGLASLGNVVVNSPWGTNRFVNTTNTIGILGNLTITAGNYRMASLHTVKGNIVNNDTLVNTSTLTLADPTNAITSTNTTAQSITGTGVFLNAVTGVTAGTANLTIRNSSAGGVVIGTKLSVSGTLTLSRGVVITNATDTFRLGTATAAGTLSGGSDTAYVNGPIYRTYPASRTAVGTYTDVTRYPVGKNGRYLPFWIDPTTTAGGPVVLSGEAFTTNAGTLGTGATSLSSVRWQSFIGAGAANFTGSNLRLTDTASGLSSTTKIMFAPSATGAYVGAAPAIVYVAGPPKTITTSGSLITAANYTGFFAYGEVIPCSAPANQPTAFNVVNLGATQFNGSFTAAASNPSNYLVVRYAAGQPEVTPVNNNVYNVNSVLGTGTVVANITSASFTQSGLTAATTYDYYVYAYNNSGCFGPVYNTTSALFAQVTTCAVAVVTPTPSAAVNVTNVGITARWSRNANPSVTYVLDVSTSNTFASFLPGYQNLSIGTDTFAVITGLSASTSYFYRVRAVDGSCASELSATITTTTACNPITTLPWFENFESLAVGTNIFPSCWSFANMSNFWFIANNLPLNGGVNSLRRTWSTDGWAFTPTMTLTVGVTYAFSYFVRTADATTPAYDITVAVGAGQNAASMTSTLASITNFQNMNWTKVTYSFTPTATADYSFGIRVVAPANPNGINFDDMKVEQVVAPTVRTGTKTAITQLSATVAGNLLDNGGSSVTTLGIVIGTSPSPTIGGAGVIDSVRTPVIQSGTYSFNVTGLSGATTYYYRAYAVNVIGTTYGADSSFTTLAAAILPTVSRSAALNISGYTATLNGNIVSNGGDPIVTSGIVYSTTSNPVIGGTGVVDSVKTPTVTSGAYTVAAAGLIPNTKYYFRAYAINSVGTAYTTQDSFTTAFVITSLPYTQNFEGGAASWTTAVIGTGLNNWVLGTPAKAVLAGAYSGTQAWVTNLTASYDNNHDAAVVSPQMDFTTVTNPVLRFYHKFAVEAGWEGFVVETSIDGGATWIRVNNVIGTGANFNTTRSFAWLNSLGNIGPIAPPKFSSTTSYTAPTNYSSNDNGWIQTATALTGMAGQSNVRVRFRFGSDASGVGEGWAIDDIEIVDVTTPTTPASAVNLTNIGFVNTTVNWTNGNGQGRMVVARLTTTPAVAPIDTLLYGSSPVFGGVDSTGAGNYIVYRSNGTSAVVTNLALLTDYTYDVYEFNGKYMHTRFAAAASSNGSTLPVTLSSFAATVKGADALLTWTTSSEIDNLGFEVERSVDGKSFEKAGFVKGAGNSNRELSYSLVDGNAFAKAGSNILYYRLKQLDANGKYSYSNIVAVYIDAENANGLSVFPNPFTTEYTVSFSANAEAVATIEMMDIQGKLVSTQLADVAKGYNAIAMNSLANLQTGIYFVKVTINGETQVMKLVKN